MSASFVRPTLISVILLIGFAISSPAGKEKAFVIASVGSNSVNVKPDAAEERKADLVILRVTKLTSINVNGHTATLADLKPGMHVKYRLGGPINPFNSAARALEISATDG